MDDEGNIDGSGSGEGGITGVLKFAYFWPRRVHWKISFHVALKIEQKIWVILTHLWTIVDEDYDDLDKEVEEEEEAGLCAFPDWLTDRSFQTMSFTSLYQFNQTQYTVSNYTCSSCSSAQVCFFSLNDFRNDDSVI